MREIIGSIDNANIGNTHYYLISSENEMYQFLTIEGKEVRSELFHAQMSNPDRMIPLEGTISDYMVAKDATKAVIQRSLKLGKDIEQNLDARLSETPPNYVGIPSSAVTGVELSKGNDFSLPHSIIRLNEKKLKFHLVRCNFSGRGN